MNGEDLLGFVARDKLVTTICKLVADLYNSKLTHVDSRRAIVSVCNYRMFFSGQLRHRDGHG